MGRPSRKFNFLIEEELYQELEQLVPPGKRSRVLNEALRKELELLRRSKAVEHLRDLAPAGKNSPPPRFWRAWRQTGATAEWPSISLTPPLS